VITGASFLLDVRATPGCTETDAVTPSSWHLGLETWIDLRIESDLRGFSRPQSRSWRESRTNPFLLSDTPEENAWLVVDEAKDAAK